jgi:iron complex outermembrane receptor protein
MPSYSRYISVLVHGSLVLSCAAYAASEPTGIEEIVVTGSPLDRSQFQLVQASTVLRGDELADAMKSSIGETLADEPGVSSTFFGPFASRPIIRGMDGDRIRVLFDGAGGVDASSVSPDHEVAGGISGAERIEILRGPATLLYGTSAVGGVVNISDGRIPDDMPAKRAEGVFTAGYATNANERSVGGHIDLSLAPDKAEKGLVAHVDAATRKSGDYKIDGFAGEEAEEEGIEGVVENSGGRVSSGTGGLSYVWDKGYFGASVGHFDSLYGSPAGHHHHHEEGEEEEEDHEEHEEHEEEHIAVRLDMKQTTFDVKGEVRELSGFISGIKTRLSVADYEHTELEGDEVGTVFSNNGTEGRVELLHKPIGNLKGAFGVHYRDRDFSAIGDEAFVPETHTRQWAGFIVETYDVGAWSFDGGLRLEDTRVINTVANVDRKFTSFAASASAAVAEEDELPVFQFAATNARFRGAELELELKVIEGKDRSLSIDGSADYVRATDTIFDQPLPRIPAMSYGIGVDGTWQSFSGRVDVQHTGEQDRVAPLETATDGYTMLNVRVAWQPFPDKDLRLVVQGRNLTDVLARSHTSFIKESVPLPGRDIRFYVRTSF